MPGQEQVAHVVGSYDGRSGSRFTVTVFSKQAASVSYGLELTCR